MNKPIAIDLYCGAGGATKGLQDAGFYVVGVDNKPQPHYCGDEFCQTDALTFAVPSDAVLVWSSPPCQFGSECTPIAHRANHPNLIPATREKLIASGKPYIIENVEAVRKWLREPVMLCGTMFGLPIYRHRYFELSWPVSFLVPPCQHTLNPVLVTKAGSWSRAKDRRLVQVSGQSSQVIAGQRVRKNSIEEKREAMGTPWMMSDEITLAIPPVYSEFLARQFISSENRPSRY